MNSTKPQTVDEYINVASPNVKGHLEELRVAVKQTAPEAMEGISYEMPAYKQNGILVYFGGFTNHVSLFPGPQAIAAYKDELVDFKTAKGTIQFPADKPLPVSLIKKIIKFKLKSNLAKKK